MEGNGRAIIRGTTPAFVFGDMITTTLQSQCSLGPDGGLNRAPQFSEFPLLYVVFTWLQETMRLCFCTLSSVRYIHKGKDVSCVEGGYKWRKAEFMRPNW
jgi:hypothetical protein